ncbi:MAG: V-type ATP synthase subunit E, partial [Methanosarcinaceae archaeon]|nr:V-type ATP synthase subunit E [Methanosarcinaceae archaeon]
MGLEKVINDIMDTAHTEISRINTEADVEESQILDEAKENAKQIRGNRLVEANLDIERMRRQEISSAKLEVKRAILNARK